MMETRNVSETSDFFSEVFARKMSLEFLSFFYVVQVFALNLVLHCYWYEVLRLDRLYN
jgi:hypothetical protein